MGRSSRPTVVTTPAAALGAALVLASCRSPSPPGAAPASSDSGAPAADSAQPPPLDSASLVDTGPPPWANDTPVLSVGTGSDIFEPLKDGDSIVSIRGPQGGFHLVAALQARGVAPGGGPGELYHPDNPTVDLVLLDGHLDPSLVQNTDLTLPGLAPEPQPLWSSLLAGYVDIRRPMRTTDDPSLSERLDEYVIFTATTYSDTVDRDVTLYARLEAVDGTVLTDVRHLHTVGETAGDKR